MSRECRLGACVAWTSGGHPSLLCYAVIRSPSGSSGLFELYVPLIIHLGCGALGQAHKELIYSLAGNERTWRHWARSRDCLPCCQEIELMDGLQQHPQPLHPLAKCTLSEPTPASHLPLTWLLSSGFNESFMVSQWERKCCSVPASCLSVHILTII